MGKGMRADKRPKQSGGKDMQKTDAADAGFAEKWMKSRLG